MTRKLYAGPDLSRVQTISELREIARRRLPDFAWQYIESGSEDEHTLANNRAAFRDYAFVPNTLVDTSTRDTSIRLFGEHLPTPLIIAPTGFNGLAHPGGDLALAKAAEKYGLPLTLSSFSNEPLETIAANSRGRLWMQLYILENPRITEELVKRAEAAGFSALVVTTDANVSSAREWQRRCYRAPGQLTVRHQLDTALHPRWLARFARSCMNAGFPRFANLTSFFPSNDLRATKGAPAVLGQLKPRITWADIKRLRDIWSGPLIIKGVLSVEDAKRAHCVGADSIVLTNHGGRQLDDALSPLRVIGPVKDALPDMPVLIDSGFRRGNDVLKAIGLGATAVLLGRATLYGLAAAGQSGVERAIQIITGEIDRSLGLLGCTHLSAVGKCLISRNPPHREEHALESCAPSAR